MDAGETYFCAPVRDWDNVMIDITCGVDLLDCFVLRMQKPSQLIVRLQKARSFLATHLLWDAVKNDRAEWKSTVLWARCNCEIIFIQLEFRYNVMDWTDAKWILIGVN